MKSILQFLFLLTFTLVQSQNVIIPDAKFKAFLVSKTSINTNGDAEISTAEAAAYTGSMDCSWKSIASLSGIESFINFNSLNCTYNSLLTLDLASNNKLTSLYCSGNKLTVLNLEPLTELTTLECTYNSLTSLNLSKNTNLTRLRTGYNQLTVLDLSKNVLLSDLGCESNKIENIDISLNVKLTSIDCRTNKLKSLNLNNGKTLFFNLMKSTGNSTLSCIQVDDMSSVRTTTWSYDNTSSFSTNCQYNLGVNDVVLNNTVKVYPNPASHIIFINSTKTIETLKVYTMSGALTKTILNPSQIDVTNWAKGTYLLFFQMGNQNLTKELIVK
ncbi:hypothetical protein FFWV33_03635 [Flavobacterium faecale]|uniref:Secretion system C-terminal sorting domain-containing protein n=1 Tax=Flavobacterium faecale TaxID=1355330 RepID=A0A2S1LAA0_9FLAO|nr:T9SS type A sorting domain-containing protein [Flavobacterium faecale]AWG20693.1 hypothetical protein FFWV33_03635 [Flavobacterium faecale]